MDSRNGVHDLAQVREQAMAKEHVRQVYKIIKDQLRSLGDPRQMPVALREPIALREHRLDADDRSPIVQAYHLPANDSSSDSGEALKSDTHPEACWTVHEWIHWLGQALTLGMTNLFNGRAQ